jgi:hypothetical protein
MTTDKEQQRDEMRLSEDSDQLLRDLADVKALEKQKRQHDISTPSFHELAEQITDKAHQVFRAAYREEVDGNKPDTTDESIDEVLERRAKRPAQLSKEAGNSRARGRGSDLA